MPAFSKRLGRAAAASPPGPRPGCAHRPCRRSATPSSRLSRTASSSLGELLERRTVCAARCRARARLRTLSSSATRAQILLPVALARALRRPPAPAAGARARRAAPRFRAGAVARLARSMLVRHRHHQYFSNHRCTSLPGRGLRARQHVNARELRLSAANSRRRPGASP